MFAGSTVLITGVTGSVGRALLYRLLNPEFSNDPRFGVPERIIGFSRDETKQFELQSSLDRRGFRGPSVELRIGDVRNRNTIAETLRDSDIVFHTAALKQVPTGEYFPAEAVEDPPDNDPRRPPPLRQPRGRGAPAALRRAGRGGRGRGRGDHGRGAPSEGHWGL